MRMRNVLVVGMLVIGCMGLLGTTAAAKASVSDNASVNAMFTVASWISLSVIDGDNVDLGLIAGPGVYTGQSTLRVMSTSPWVISDQIIWSSSVLPGDADSATEDLIESNLTRTYDDSGSWGVYTLGVDYSFSLQDEDFADLPAGDYVIVIEYTATTD
ncbi:hypothetical protein JW848_02675 [Candidatus Bipolaricaulota bacterium]|nr:hypothetical protein [Candidatus Bipolaricaulota bacterium]